MVPAAEYVGGEWRSIPRRLDFTAPCRGLSADSSTTAVVPRRNAAKDAAGPFPRRSMMTVSSSSVPQKESVLFGGSHIHYHQRDRQGGAVDGWVLEYLAAPAWHIFLEGAFPLCSV